MPAVSLWNSSLGSHSVLTKCSVLFSYQIQIIPPYGINWCLYNTDGFHCEVWTEFIHIIWMNAEQGDWFWWILLIEINSIALKTTRLFSKIMNLFSIKQTANQNSAALISSRLIFLLLPSKVWAGEAGTLSQGDASSVPTPSEINYYSLLQWLSHSSTLLLFLTSLSLKSISKALNIY
jgi:hypothetical protein